MAAPPPENALYDLLISVDQSVWAVNCRIEGPALHCGALYVSPQIPFELIRFTHNGGTLDVHLPEKLRNLTGFVRLWEAPLPLATK